MRVGNRVAVLAAIVAGLLALPALGQPVVIKFSHVVAPDTPKGKAAARFEELAERYTDGAVDVQVFPNSQLYKDKEELEALQLGAVQMLAPSLAKFGPLGVPDFEVFDLPFIFRDYQALHAVTMGPVGKDLLARLEDKGITGLAYWDNGFKIMSANRPLRMPADFRGLRMRIQASRVLEAQMAALGAVPQVMAFSEVEQALRAGLVDGAENTPSNMYTQGMNAVQPYATISNHGYLGYAVIVNSKFWDELPDDLRAALERAMAEATDYGNSIAKGENDAALAAMRAAGTTEFHELTETERAAWMAALLPVQDAMADRIGAGTLAAVRAASGG
ncbi:TRAP transporter substrate-binding protein [Tabrizicola fusiformis]|uniref:TRAP transporter substrate-binding protein n=1 Tax=Tabrizicola sp. SY72 TaxID=2741673 RepID=UPI0015737793|nr:TRAP transporter substrate-binding protein [Tabrizicola sp. SY72]NTT85317.1 TRAP transporter substrate-binding protein [Tabrizicola sp. SY72]